MAADFDGAIFDFGLVVEELGELEPATPVLLVAAALVVAGEVGLEEGPSPPGPLSPSTGRGGARGEVALVMDEVGSVFIVPVAASR